MKTSYISHGMEKFRFGMARRAAAGRIRLTDALIYLGLRLSRQIAADCQTIVLKKIHRTELL